MQLWIQVPGNQDNVNIIGIVRKAGGQPACVFNPGFAQSFLQGRIADQDINAALSELRRFLLVLLDHYKVLIRAHQVAHQV